MRLTVIRMIRQLGATINDTLLRAWAAGEEPLHVSEILYAWRINPGSTASVETGSKPQTLVSQQHVLDHFLRARGWPDVYPLRRTH
jgi:hypothetical protein